MKRLFNLGILLLTVSLIVSSCKQKTPIEVSDVKLVASETNYWGDYYGKGTSIFDLFLFDDKYEASPTENKSGIVIYFDISGPSKATELPTGTYRATTDRRPFTFYRGERELNEDNTYSTYGSYFEIWKNGDVIDYWIITSGNLTVDKSGNYIVKGIVTTGNNEAYNFLYRGRIDNYDVTPWPDTLVKGEIVYEGRVTGNNGDRNKFTIYLGGKNVNLSNLTGDGDIFVVELYSPINLNNSIVPGTYYVEFDTQGTMTIMDGYQYLGTDNYYHDAGTWYYTSKKFAIANGDMIIGISGNTYNLDFQFFTESGMKISQILNLNMQTFSSAPAAKVKSTQQRVSPDLNRNVIRSKVNSPRTLDLSGSRMNNQRKIVR